MIVEAETTCLNAKTTYLDAVADAQRRIHTLAQAIADCRHQHQNQPSTTPIPPNPEPVNCSGVTLPNVIHVTSNADNSQVGAVIPGSLRAAINQANASNQPAAIQIDFSQLNNPTIMLQQDLPAITHRIYLDGGATQQCLMLVIDGSQASVFDTQNTGGEAFDLKANNSTIRYVDFVNFHGNPVLIQGNDDAIAACNVGVDPTGEISEPNAGVGIAVVGSSDTVGSLAPGNGNIVSSNGLTGIAVFKGTNNTVEGNIVGLDAAGTTAMGNGSQAKSGQDGSGIVVDSASNTIGGAIAQARNVISANFQQGIAVGGWEISTTTCSEATARPTTMSSKGITSAPISRERSPGVTRQTES